MEIPEQVKYILETLNDAGFEAYIVGGCVRDQLIGKMPEDWDITTSATPAQIKLLFNNTADTGIRHGTVSVLFPYGCGQVSEKDKACNYKKYEITTFRADGAYEDARRPSEVKFLKSLPGDLARRDFTINAMAWHPETGLIDPFKGADDIRAKIIRTVGKAEERFGEDALRMLRAVRFAARLGFTLHEHVLAGMAQNAALILNISQERIRDELTGILMSHKPEMLSILMSTGILHYILPELEACYRTQQNNSHHIYNVGEHSLKAVSYVEKDFVLRWTMLLHDIGKPLTKVTNKRGVDSFPGHKEESVKLSKDIMKRLRFDKKSIKKIITLIDNHDIHIELTDVNVRKAISKVGKDAFPDLIKVILADKMAQQPNRKEKGIEYVNKLGELYKDTVEKGHCLSIPELKINGDDLINIGFAQGKEIKDVLEILLNMVLEKPVLNRREELIRIAKQMRSNN